MIVGVAVKTDRKLWTLPRPYRHHNVLRMIFASHEARNYETEQEGFVDSDGNFLTRIEAMQVAINNGQLNRRPGSNKYQGPELFSEDQW